MLTATSDAPSAGRHRLDPGSLTSITISASTTTVAPTAVLSVTVPPGWAILDPTAGEAAIADGTIRWPLGDLAAGRSLERRVLLRTPVLGSSSEPVTDGVIATRLDAANGSVEADVLRLRVAPELVMEHPTFARVDDATHVPAYLVTDASLTGIAAFDTVRVRFQVRNADAIPASFTPRLQYRPVGSARWLDLPTGGAESGLPFYLSDEWRPVGNGRPGTVPGPDRESIPTGDLKARDTDVPAQRAVAGLRLMGATSAPVVTLAGDTYTEVEFTVRATIDLPYTEAFMLRLTDDGRPLVGAVEATITSGPKPPLVLSPGQQHGIDVGAPVDASAVAASASAALRDDVDYALISPDRIIEAEGGVATALPRYRLAYVAPAEPDAPGAVAAPFDSPHVPDPSLVSDTCARCHSAHAGQGRILLPDPNPQSTLCLSCHDGINGSTIDIAGQYQDPSVPQNDPATRSYYRHDAMLLSDHILAGENEFGGVSERHSECADCHNPHNSVPTDATQTTTGWTTSGRQAALSGVAVTNGAAGTAPTYAFLDGSVNAQPSREYEICLKCHSGFTVLPSNDGEPPSRWALDKGIELNPGNASYHPVEAAGRNQTTAMANSLAGTSPYKQWNFQTTGTVRCVNCHGDPAKYDAATPPPAGSALAPHTSPNRGLLLQGYRDRELKPATEAYRAEDFALCYLCHAEAPFRNASSATNFDFHALHVSDLQGRGSGNLDIDMPGAGQGNAICAECHFRVHGTALRYGSQGAYPRLVNFAPNVRPFQGTLRFELLGTGSGSCTLICHGEGHDNEGY